MALYCIGDVQGCSDALDRLLAHIDFSPSRDTVYLLGDLVNRGPDSLGVLQRCMRYAGSVHALLGNHDLHLLATAAGVRPPGRRDTLAPVLHAPERVALLDWLRQQPLMREHVHAGQSLWMVHAGLLPQWTAPQALALAAEVQTVLQGPDWMDYLHTMYGNTPDVWDEALTGSDRLRVIVNALTRLRFCTPHGRMDFESTESAVTPPAGLQPWFDAPQRRSSGQLLAFGHWSTLGWMNRPDLLALDTGCVWGGALTAVRFGVNLSERECCQVACPAMQTPGKK